MSYFVIGDEDTVLGFRLAGVEGVKALSRDDLLEALGGALANASVKIILIPERLAHLVRDEVDRILETMDFPLVLEIPDRQGPMPGRKTLRDLVKSAVGLSV